jgi:uncharacterized protein YjbI with pentapeptide repeats
VSSGKTSRIKMMVPTSHKKISLEKEASTGFSSLLSQGGLVLVGFGGMLLLTGGAPSGLIVGLTVIFSGAAVTWLEQDRLSKISKCLYRRRIRQPKNSLEVLADAYELSEKHSEPVSILSLPFDKSDEAIKKWIQLVITQGMSANKTAILRRKLSKLALETNDMKKVQSLISVIAESSNNFFLLASLVNLDPLRDFAGCDLRGVQLDGLNLSGADLRKANLWLLISNSDSLPIKTSMVETNLSNANLSEADLVGADLTKADLSGADLSRAKLNGVDLHETDLSGVNLDEADLSGANLYGANLSQTHLSGACVRNARFRDNIGLLTELKHDLQSRGAIFEDSYGDKDRVFSLH